MDRSCEFRVGLQNQNVVPTTICDTSEVLFAIRTLYTYHWSDPPKYHSVRIEVHWTELNQTELIDFEGLGVLAACPRKTISDGLIVTAIRTHNSPSNGVSE